MPNPHTGHEEREKQLFAAVEFAKQARNQEGPEMIILAVRNMMDHDDAWMMAVQEAKQVGSDGRMAAAPFVAEVEKLGKALICATSTEQVRVEGLGFLPVPIGVVMHMLTDHQELKGVLVNSEAKGTFMLDPQMAAQILETEIGGE